MVKKQKRKEKSTFEDAVIINEDGTPSKEKIIEKANTNLNNILEVIDKNQNKTTEEDKSGIGMIFTGLIRRDWRMIKGGLNKSSGQEPYAIQERLKIKYDNISQSRDEIREIYKTTEKHMSNLYTTLKKNIEERTKQETEIRKNKIQLKEELKKLTALKEKSKNPKQTENIKQTEYDLELIQRETKINELQNKIDMDKIRVSMMKETYDIVYLRAQEEKKLIPEIGKTLAIQDGRIEQIDVIINTYGRTINTAKSMAMNVIDFNEIKEELQNVARMSTIINENIGNLNNYLASEKLISDDIIARQVNSLEALANNNSKQLLAGADNQNKYKEMSFVECYSFMNLPLESSLDDISKRQQEMVADISMKRMSQEKIDELTKKVNYAAKVAIDMKTRGETSRQNYTSKPKYQLKK